MPSPASTLERPAAWPSRVVRLAARALPVGAARDRYRAEFLAELWGMDRSRQVRHALGLVTHVWSLRAAVTSQGLVPPEEPRMKTAVRKPLLCRLNLHHTWVRHRTEDGSSYRQCARCGKDDGRSRGSMDGTTGMAAGFGTIAGT
jgi:hypothetical protein